jgi:hypothetical protein
MVIQFFSLNEIKQMIFLWIIGKSEKLANYARNRYRELAYEDEHNISMQNRPFPEHPDYPDYIKKHRHDRQ